RWLSAPNRNPSEVNSIEQAPSGVDEGTRVRSRPGGNVTVMTTPAVLWVDRASTKKRISVKSSSGRADGPPTTGAGARRSVIASTGPKGSSSAGVGPEEAVSSNP